MQASNDLRGDPAALRRGWRRTDTCTSRSCSTQPHPSCAGRCSWCWPTRMGPGRLLHRRQVRERRSARGKRSTSRRTTRSAARGLPHARPRRDAGRDHAPGAGRHRLPASAEDRPAQLPRPLRGVHAAASGLPQQPGHRTADRRVDTRSATFPTSWAASPSCAARTSGASSPSTSTSAPASARRSCLSTCSRVSLGDHRVRDGRRAVVPLDDGARVAAQRVGVLHAHLGRLPLPARGRAAHRSRARAALPAAELGRHLQGWQSTSTSTTGRRSTTGRPVRGPRRRRPRRPREVARGDRSVHRVRAPARRRTERRMRGSGRSPRPRSGTRGRRADGAPGSARSGAAAGRSGAVLELREPGGEVGFARRRPRDRRRGCGARRDPCAGRRAPSPPC